MPVNWLCNSRWSYNGRFLQHCGKNGRYNFPFPPFGRPNRPVGGWERALGGGSLNRSDRVAVEAPAKGQCLSGCTSWPLHEWNGADIQENGHITNRFPHPSQSLHGFGDIVRMSHNMNAFLFHVYPLLRSRSFVSNSWFPLVATSMTAVSCRMLYERADRNSNVDLEIKDTRV